MIYLLMVFHIMLLNWKIKPRYVEVDVHCLSHTVL